MDIGIKLVGVDKVLTVLNSLIADAPHEVAAGIYQEAELLMTESKKEIPVDTGTAMNSGFVEEPKILGTKISVTLGYGGPAAKINPATGQSSGEYIEIIHEDLKARHKAGRKAKFLEDPAKRRAQNFLNRVRARVQSMIRRRTK